MRETKDIIINGRTLEDILADHLHWWREDCDGWENMRANLYRANLYRADLSRANLSGANLYRADLSRANLSGANLSRADLFGANLYRADLSRANLSEANLSGANLYRADLSRANLSGANLSRANLSGAENVPFIPMACPDYGEFTGWKKGADDEIIELVIPADARRSSSTGRKCRCDKARVVSIADYNGNERTEARSHHDSNFAYRVGEMVTSDFCEDRFQECAEGIHFFINRQEAVEYGWG